MTAPPNLASRRPPRRSMTVGQLRRNLRDVLALIAGAVEFVGARLARAVALGQGAGDMTISLAFLAPDLVKAAVEGRCRAGSELPVSAMPRPSGRVSTGCSASPVLSLRKLYLTQWCAPAPRARSKLIGRYGALLPLFRLVGVPCIAAFGRVKSLLCHHSDRPKLANRSVGYFAGATSLTGVPSALVFSPCLLASSRSRSISPARRSCTPRVSSAFFRSSKIL